MGSDRLLVELGTSLVEEASVEATAVVVVEAELLDEVTSVVLMDVISAVLEGTVAVSEVSTEEEGLQRPAELPLNSDAAATKALARYDVCMT